MELASDNGPMRIRAAAEADLPVMQDIERAAGTAFAEVGMQEIADDEPPSLGELDRKSVV